MAKFLGIHKMPDGSTTEQVKESWEKYKSAAQAKGMTPLHAFFSSENGTGYCETEANTMQDVADAHQDAGVPVDEIVQIEELV